MRVIFYDVESAPNISYTWGTYKQFVAPNQIAQPQRVICFAAKEYGKERVKFMSEQNGHEKMIRELHKVLSEADAVVGYNHVNFDNRMVAAEFLRYGLPPLPPSKQVDLFRVIKKNFRFPSMKLEYVAPALGLGKKIKHAGFELWTRCMAGERSAWAEMKDYNIQDTELLEKLYVRLLPYLSNHPSHSLDTEALVCTNCGSGKLQRRGYQTTKVGRFGRFQCQACGHWMRSRTNELERGKELMVSL